MDMLDQVNVINNNELKTIVGGKTLSGNLINYFNKVLSTFLDVGRNIGSSLRRFISKNKCPL